MKNICPKGLIVIILLTFLQIPALSQISVSSSAGYTVMVNVLPTKIVPGTLSCTYGYNYNVKLNYSVTFTGSNIPASLYTLQGYIGCGTGSNFFDLPNSASAGTVTSTSNPWNAASDCATSTVSSLHCTTAKIEIAGLGIASQTLSFPITYTSLPVNFTSFSITAVEDKVKINWTTATEINSDYFSIERSVNGIDWIEINRIPASGNSYELRQYSSFDDRPVSGSVYYRIKETDTNGSSTYTEIRSIQFRLSNAGIALFPIPNSGNTIHISGIVSYSNYLLILETISGSPIHRTVLSSETVELPELKPAVYIIELKNTKDGTTKYLRYLKV